MITYYSKDQRRMAKNLTKMVKDTLSNTNEFYYNWFGLESWQTRRDAELLLEPGRAYYFIGGRKSLQNDLRDHWESKIITSDGAGISIAIQTGITFSGLTQIGSFFKAKIPGTTSQFAKNLTIALNTLKQKKLTVVAVYHSQTMMEEPNTRLGVKLIGDELESGQLYAHVNNLLVGEIEQRIEDRQGAVDNLYAQLNM